MLLSATQMATAAGVAAAGLTYGALGRYAALTMLAAVTAAAGIPLLRRLS